MTQGKFAFDKFAQDAALSGKDQVEAVIKSGTLFAKGAEDFLKAYVALAQSSAEKNASAFKSLLGSKTLNEFTETQNKIAQQNFDDFMAGATKLSELGIRVTTEALEPINDQISKSIKKAADSLAA